MLANDSEDKKAKAFTVKPRSIHSRLRGTNSIVPFFITVRQIPRVYRSPNFSLYPAGYGTLALLDHVLDRRENTCVCLTYLLHLCMRSE